MPCCPFCAKDISFMAPAFDKTFHPVPSSPSTSFAAPAEVRSDEVYGRDLQSLLWERMHEKAALWSGMTAREVVANTVAQRRQNRDDGSVVLHLFFDKSVTPRGNVIYREVSASVATVNTHLSYDEASLCTMGYAVVDHKIQVADDVPVGPIWNILQYWAGERQHKRWHMARPLKASPRRNDCPAFMDEKMCAVQVWYADDERLFDSLLELAQLCETGINGSPAVGAIRAMMLG